MEKRFDEGKKGGRERKSLSSFSFSFYFFFVGQAAVGEWRRSKIKAASCDERD